MSRHLSGSGGDACRLGIRELPRWNAYWHVIPALARDAADHTAAMRSGGS